jgi:hypothetical protein
MRRFLTVPFLALLVFAGAPADASSRDAKKKPAEQLPPEVIQRVVRTNFGKFRLCYEAGLRNCPNLSGRVTVNFTIQPSGTVSRADSKGSDIPDAAVAKCVAARFKELVFPSFEGPPIKVTYPVVFTPGG